MCTVLHVPGLRAAGPEHWMSHWERAYGHRRVRQTDWEHPVRELWTRTLDEAVESSAGRVGGVLVHASVVLVGHSLGCNTIVCWAEDRARLAPASDARSPVAGALLVAPSDCEAPAYPREPVGFTPIPLGRLPFPSIVVASSDDPFATLDSAAASPSAGSCFIEAGALGHLNSAARLGLWPQGYACLRELTLIGDKARRLTSRPGDRDALEFYASDGALHRESLHAGRPQRTRGCRTFASWPRRRSPGSSNGPP